MSKTRNSFLSSSGPNRFLHSRGAAADHLPELGLRPDRFEEEEVNDLGHVDAGVEHVDRDRNARGLVRYGEVVDELACIGHPVGDDLCELAQVLGVVRVEPFGDELGVVLVAREDDGLAKPFAAVDLDAVLLERLECLVDRVLVEEVLVDGFSLDAVGDGALRVPFELAPLVPLFLGELVVALADAGES
ncbi:hypothetical protein [Glycomyces sp. MUSA5-2]|uniref:hypothetical protein n=1 Tax=Glycomyces sp. MUSA5-2 TaxID=2053002 RepID=UPI0030081748